MQRHQTITRMNTWTPLWSGIVESSIWDEPDHVVKVFLTMLAIKDPDFTVRKTAYQLAKLSRKSESEVLDALKVLSSPDKIRNEKQPYDGRRVRAVEDGWLILNGLKYREQVKLEMQRARNRKAQAAYRARQKAGLLPGEASNQVFERNGATQQQLDEHQTSCLPEKLQEAPPAYQVGNS